MATGIAIAGLVIGIAGERKKEKQLEKAEEREELARQKQRDIQDVQTRRQRVQARRQARSARAERLLKVRGLVPQRLERLVVRCLNFEAT